MAAELESDAQLEIGRVLFMDIVGFLHSSNEIQASTNFAKTRASSNSWTN